MIFLSGIKIKAAEGYPFIPLIVNTPSFTFTQSVTVICGDNGCGKTTFAKIVATACRSACIAEEGVFGHVADRFTALRKFIPKRSFYFSAEQFVQFVRDVEARREDAKAALREIDRSDLSDYAKSLAKMPHAGTLASFDRIYGADLSQASHGQGFLAFFNGRLKKDGLYVIDEPEAALSAENQFLLAARIKHAAEKDNCQFIICTHSPIVSAIPDADVYEVQNDNFLPTKWEDLQNVSFLSMFFKNKDRLF